MNGFSACPGDDTLVRFLAKRAPAVERERTARHVESCSACALVLAVPESSAQTMLRARTPSDRALPATLIAGRLLAGRYRIIRLLGTGGMGEVYEAFDQTLGEAVALKTVRATIAGNPHAVELLKAEVQLARRVTHRNVCRMFDFGLDRSDGDAGDLLPFLTMELLRGTTLARRLIAKEAISPQQILSTARQIATGLQAAHAVGIIHKDLKSENIILTGLEGGGWRAIVTDFGLAATRGLVDDSAPEITHFSGTPGYIAPERMLGRPATEASDVFAFGVVLVDLITGTLPTRRSLQPISAAPLASLRTLARRCQAIDPAARPALAEVLETLARMEQRPAAARVRTVGRSLAAAACAAVVMLAVAHFRAPRPAAAGAAAAPPREVSGLAAPPAPPVAASRTPSPAVATATYLPATVTVAPYPVAARPRRSRARRAPPRAAAALVTPAIGHDEPIRELSFHVQPIHAR